MILVMSVLTSWDSCQHRSHQVLCGNIDSITLGMPGSALSDHNLADAELPHVEEMVADSLDACCMFKRQAAVPERAPTAPPNAPDTDILTDLDGKPALVHALAVAKC